jgi:hypothetical protein
LKYVFILAVKRTRDLIRSAAAVLGVPEATVRSRVMLLRKESLWSSEGKGISANLVPSDASNLLLSFLGGGFVTKAAETVRMIRCCEHILNRRDQKSLPPVDLFADLGLDHTLGEMLDAVFEKWSDRGPISATGDPITGAYLFVERYRQGWEAELFLKDSNAQWEVHYEFLGPRGRVAVPFPKDDGGDLCTSARVTKTTFSALAKCVSGRPSNFTNHPARADRGKRLK